MPVLRVLWKWQRNACRASALAHARASSVTCAGTADADRVGEADLDAARLRRHALRHVDRPARRGISPSNGQPKAAEIVTCARMPAARAARAISSHVAMDSSVPTPWLRRLKVSLATTTMPTLVAAGCRRAIEAFAIQHQSDEMGVARPAETGQHLLGVGHLRHLARIDEAGDLDATQAGGQQPGDQLDLGGRGEDERVDLQAVARPDLDHFDLSPHGSGSYAIHPCIGKWKA